MASNEPVRNARAYAAVIGTCLIATVLFFHRAVFTSDVFIARDIFRVYYPLRSYWAERVSVGEFPHWFGADGLGQPFVGMLISGAFHPSNLLYLVLPLGDALKVNVLLCYPAAFLGVYALARRLGCSRAAAQLAGMAFAFCGFLVGLTNNLLYLEAAATVPWVLWATDRILEARSPGRIVLAAALLTLLGFTGDGQTFALMGGLMLALALVRHRPGRVLEAVLATGAAVASALALSAVQILPAVAAFPESATGSRDLSNILTWSMHPAMLLEVILGSIYGGDAASAVSMAITRELLQQNQSSVWVESLHVGVPLLVLAGAGALALRRTRGFALAAALTAVLAVLVLGKYGGLYRLAVDYVPFWSAFRYPLKLAPLVLLPVALAAAAGFDAIERDARLMRRVRLVLGVTAGAAGLGWASARLWDGGVVRAAWKQFAGGEVLERLVQTTTVALGQTALATLATLLIVAVVKRAGLRRPLLVATIGVHLFAVNEPLYLVTDRQVIEAPPPFALEIAEREPRHPEPTRVTDVLDFLPVPNLPEVPWADRVALAASRSLAAESQVLWGFESTNTYLPATSARYRDLCRDKRLWLPRYSSLFSTRYAVLPGATYEQIGGARDAVLAEDRRFELVLLRNDRAAPRAYLARPRCVADRAAALSMIEAHPMPPGVAIIECGSPAAEPPPGPGDLGMVTIVSYRPEQVVLSVVANHRAVVVLNDAYYRGWSATVDSAPAEIRPANVAVRSVEVEPGTHQVVFSYRAPGLLFGAWVTGLSGLGALLVCAGWALRERSQRKSRLENTTTAAVRNAAV